MSFDDLAGLKTGERIQRIRERKGFSRDVVAGMVGKTGGWLKLIERGKRQPPRLPVLVSLAEVLGVSDLAVLCGTDMNLGEPVSLPVASFRRVPHAAVPGIREAIHAQPFTRPEVVDLESLAQRLAGTWKLWHSSPTQRTDVGRVLPGLITDARAAVSTAETSADRRAASALVANVYALVEQLIAWAAEPELVWVAVDRGIAAARDADRPATLAGAAWVLGNVRRAVGDLDAAVELADDAIALVRPYLESGDDDLRSLYGALHLHAAVSCARAGRDGDAWRYWDEGNATAERLPRGYHHPWTQFGESNVKVHAVSIGTDLSKSQAARDRAEEIDPESVPSLERRSRLLIETGRSYHQRRDYGTSLEWLKRAYAVSSENVHYSPLARQMTSEIIDSAGPMHERSAHAFGQLLGLPA